MPNNGNNKKILLTGVFGPFARDDEFGSRKVNPMELYHNQVTRVQGPFSLRMFHRTFGLLMIEANIDAPCTVLDFPDYDRFISEISSNHYDIVGISSIVSNIKKTAIMCDLIRKYLPGAVIVIGGHIASKENLAALIDADYICRGDGIRWFRNYLGQPADDPINHPVLISGFGVRIMGSAVSDSNTAATIIPSVGCPFGCNFCSTSALFGGKGNSVVFYETGDELYRVLAGVENQSGVNSFFILDENFLFYRERALRLLELIEQNGKSWSFYIFSSARVLSSYSMEQLVSLGVSWVWLGLEGRESKYSKLNGVDTVEMIRRFHENGIRVLGSTIIGMEEHSDENINEAIAYAVSHETDFHQFMLYTPLPGTPLYRECSEKNRLLPEGECPDCDIHGQERFNFIHPGIKKGREKEYLLRAFEEDLRINGPSLARITLTTLNGWLKYRKHPDKRIRRRFKQEKLGLSTIYAASVFAMKLWYRRDEYMRRRMGEILSALYSAFGFLSRIAAPLIGAYLFVATSLENRRLARGWTYEPPVFYEKNDRALALEGKSSPFSFSKIKLPVYDVQQVIESCRSQMEDVRLAFYRVRDEALAKVHQIRTGMPGFADLRSSGAEQVTELMKSVSQISDEMHNRYSEACFQLDGIRRRMQFRRKKASAHINEMTDAVKLGCRSALQTADAVALEIKKSLNDLIEQE